MPTTFQAAQGTKLASLVPVVHVKVVRRSVDFYQLLGFVVNNSFEQDGRLQWAWLQNGDAHLMLAHSDRPLNPGAQDILFYLYAPDVAAYRAELDAKGVKVGAIKYPFYSPRGEFRIDDTDGYTVFVSHADRTKRVIE